MNILILSDGKAGHINQSVAYAKHCKANYEIVSVTFKSNRIKMLSYLLDYLYVHSTSLFKLGQPQGKVFDTIVSTGSDTYYANKTLSQIHGLKSITMMLPKGYKYNFDTIFAQQHDNPPKRKNIISLPANMSFTEPKGLFTPTKKAIGIIIGGDNAVFTMQEERLKQQIDFIVETFKDYEIALTTSPRTSPTIEKMLEQYHFTYSVIFSQNKINPIADFLEHCETVFITMDSTSMISEAISYGHACVEVLPLDEKKDNKFYKMAQSLEKEGFLHIFDGTIAQNNQKIDFIPLIQLPHSHTMKIVQLLPELREGGVERGVVELSRELVKRGHQSVVISNGGKLVEQIVKDGGLHVQLDVCSKNTITAPWRIFKLYRSLKKLKPDVLHVRSRVPAWMVYFANRYLHIPLISTVHGFNSINAYSRIMTQANQVICVSTAIKNYVNKNYKTPEAKLNVIPRGIDLEKFNPQNLDATFIDTFKNQFALQDKWIISTVGRITQLKDLETFIKAIALLKKDFPNVVGLIVGGVREDKQKYVESLQHLVETLHVNEEIHFCGSVDKVAEIYALSDIVVSSSKKPESFGRSVAEAIALNTPVVATNHGGVLDIIQEGINGYFSKISDEEDLAAQIIKAKTLEFDGYTYISENFSLEQMVEKTLAIYQTQNKASFR